MLDLELARNEVRASEYPLDIQISLSHYKEKKTERKNSSLENSVVTETSEGQSFGLAKKFFYGTEIELSAQTMNISSDSLNVIAPIRNQSAILLKFNQPLLRERSVNGRLSEHVKSKLKLERYENKLKEVINREIKKTLDLYFDIYQIQNEMSVTQSNVEIYSRLYEYYVKASKVGRKNKIKKYEALSLLKKEEALLEKKYTELFSSKLQFLKQVGNEKGEVDDVIYIDLFLKQPVEGNVKYADLKLKQLRLKAKESLVDLKKIKDNTLPLLDLELEYLSPGLGRNKKDSFQNSRSFDYPNFTISLNFKWSFGSSSRKNNITAAQKKYDLQDLIIKKEGKRKKNELKMIDHDLTMISKMIEGFENRVAIALEKVLIREKLYIAGKISILDFNEAVKESSKVRLDLVKNQILKQKKYNQKLSEYGVYTRN